MDEFINKLENTIDLIYKNEVDPFYISISLLLEEFFLFLKEKRVKDLEKYMECLLLIALLIHLKILRFLGAKERDEEVSEILISLTDDDEKISVIADFLLKRKEIFENLFKREVFLEEEIKIEPYNLYKIFTEIISQFKEEKIIFDDIPKIEEKMKEIIEKLEFKKSLRFKEIFQNCKRKIEVIVYFLALLELLKNKKIKLVQKGLFSEIYIYST
ncbi:MAG: segregation/condensation protein A [candidate division WOR-3 bacterium]